MSFNIRRLIGSTQLKLKAEAPTIAIGAGVVGLVGSVVLAGKASMDLQTVIDDHKDGVKKLESDYELIRDDRNADGSLKFTEQQYSAAHLNVYIQTGKKLLKMYAPTIALAGLSIASIVYGRNAFAGRIAALSSAYQIATNTLDKYRKAVEAEIGGEKEADIYGSALENELTKGFEKDEEGNLIHDENRPSIYARFFDESSINYTRMPGENQLFVKTAQAYFNDLLNIRGWVALNEVYEYLGMDTTPEGQIIGWVAPRDRQVHVDFGIFDSKRETARRFVNELEQSVLLDFNVTGSILGKM